MSTEALDFSELPVQLHQFDNSVPLEEIAAVFQKKLAENFHSVSVEVIDCPDLTKEPYNLAAEGLGGNPVIIELGSVQNLLPLVNRRKCYDLNTVPKLVGDDKCFIIGAGAGPWPHKGVNCEGIYNVVVHQNKVVVPGTRLAIVDEQQKCKLEMVPASENRCCLLGNLFSSRGEKGQVVKVHCKKRIGELNFVTAMRLALEEAFPDKFLGMGGVFVIREGHVKQHVMPDFSKTPIETDEQLNNWLKFYNMSSPLSAVGTFVNKDPGLDLRPQHFHSFSKTEGGHYHYDTTPETVEYLAILATGCFLARVDRQQEESTFGKD